MAMKSARAEATGAGSPTILMNQLLPLVTSSPATMRDRGSPSLVKS
jgi:hypothetical protein